MNIVDINLSELKPYERNPRKNDEAVKYVAQSIREFGFKVPIVCDEKYTIIAGHTRYKAAAQLGLTKVPCIIASDLSPDQVKAFRLADNKVGEIATWDKELLGIELSDLLGSFDMSDFGFDLDALVKDEVEEDDYDIELPDQAKSKPGEIYQLGRHRLMCGDSTDANQVRQLIGSDGLIDCVVTDPPYNVNYESDAGLSIQNDNMDHRVFKKFLTDAFLAMDDALKPGGVFYIWHSDSEGLNFRGACEEVGWQVRQCLIWNKNGLVMGRQDYQWKHEPCLYGWKSGAGHYFINDRTQTTVYEDKIDIDTMKKEELKALVKEMLSGTVPTTIINENKPIASAEHPTMKPLKLLARLVQNSTRHDEKVLDTFGGSGSTLITCEQLGRSCYMMELDPKYVDVIINRWEAFTGEKAVKI